MFHAKICILVYDNAGQEVTFIFDNIKYRHTNLISVFYTDVENFSKTP